MLDMHAYYFFVGTSVVLVISPGPDTILLLSRTLASGAMAGFMVLIGTQVGNVIQAVSAGVGGSTIICFFLRLF
jgi:threonine/homoserine/homoserine lactone efflux protein